MQTSRKVGTTKEKSFGDNSKSEEVSVEPAFAPQVPQESIITSTESIGCFAYKETEATSFG